MKFDYYYGSQADQFSFIRIPRMMLTEDTFNELTLQAKILYSVLLDRMTLSMKNGWFDEKNRAYIIYQISEIQTDLGFSKKKAMIFRILLIPVWLVMAIAWIAVSMLVSAGCIAKSLVSGILLVGFIGSLIWFTTEWWRYIILAIAEGILLSILCAGIAVEMILGEISAKIGEFIIFGM